MGRGVGRAQLLAALAAALALPVALVAAVGTFRAVAPVDDDALAASQVAFLRGAVASGAPRRMAALFPEGGEFTAVLTAIADLELAARGRTDREDAMRSATAALSVADDPDTIARFGVDDPPGGVFLAGWALHVAVRRAEVRRTPADRLDVRRRAEVLGAALDRALGRGRPFLASYPGQVWPVDTVVAVAALHRVQQLASDPGRADVLTRWRAAAAAHLDRDTGLPPHRTDLDAQVIDGPRGTSSALALAFWAEAFGEPAASAWADFTRTFVVRRVGLLGVREYPLGRSGPLLGDVDSGPLIAGVSASASVVALAGARRYGDRDLERALQREAEVFGVPVHLPAGRRYAAGVLPVGDAFLAWARAQPAAGTTPEGGSIPRAVIWPWPAAALLGSGAVAFWALRRLTRRDPRGQRPGTS